MTAWIVTGSILLFFVILLFSPIIISAGYHSGVITANVRYLVIKLDFSPETLAKRPGKKSKKKAAKEVKAQEAETSPKEDKAAKNTLETIRELLTASRKSMDIIRHHLIFYKIRVIAVAGGEDAHKTGNAYATYCILIPSVISLLDALFVVREPEVLAIRPDFLKEKPEFDISLKVRIAPWFLLAAALVIVIRIIKINLAKPKRRKRKVKVVKKVKGGKKHEPTASYK